jgi:NAD-dependent deacetylase
MRIFVITGAGISAESGIPTFRGKEGYWRNLDPAKLATSEAFKRDPDLVWEWYRERRQRIRHARPNAAHDAVVRLATSARDFLLVTQNVDDLHARAGLAKEKMVQIHGDIFVTRCSRCDFSAREEDCGPTAPAPRNLSQRSAQKLDGLKPSSFAPSLPHCPECGALMRPGVVWFGEQLDSDKIELVENYLAGGTCDYVLVIGTTAVFGYIIDWALRASSGGSDLIEINPDETPLSSFARRSIRESAAVAVPKFVTSLLDRQSA